MRGVRTAGIGRVRMVLGLQSRRAYPAHEGAYLLHMVVVLVIVIVMLYIQ